MSITSLGPLPPARFSQPQQPEPAAPPRIRRLVVGRGVPVAAPHPMGTAPAPASISGDSCHVRARCGAGGAAGPSTAAKAPGCPQHPPHPKPGSLQEAHPLAARSALRAGAGAGASGGVFVPAAGARRRRREVRAPLARPVQAPRASRQPRSQGGGRRRSGGQQGKGPAQNPPPHPAPPRLKG